MADIFGGVIVSGRVVGVADVNHHRLCLLKGGLKGIGVKSKVFSVIEERNGGANRLACEAEVVIRRSKDNYLVILAKERATDIFVKHVGAAEILDILFRKADEA